MTQQLDHHAAPELDQAVAEEFAGRVFSFYVGGMLTYMIDIGHRTGLWDALTEGPATAAELAERSGLVERYVREWLSSLAAGGVVSYDAASGRFTLPAEHAICLTGNTAFNLAPQSQMITLLARYVTGVAEAFRDGGGVPYAAYRPEFTDVMDGLTRGVMASQLIETIVPAAGLHEALASGIRVADVGCGTGYATRLLAQQYPASTFVGFDIAADAIERAREEAAASGLENVRYEVADGLELPTAPPLDAVFAFDTIHDLADPAGVLARIHAALAPGGTFVMYDIDAASGLEDNLENPLAPFLYGVSTLHCMTVSLSENGAGLGTAWGREQASALLADAGFAPVTIRDLESDPLNCLYVAHRSER